MSNKQAKYIERRRRRILIRAYKKYGYIPEVPPEKRYGPEMQAWWLWAQKIVARAHREAFAKLEQKANERPKE